MKNPVIFTLNELPTPSVQYGDPMISEKYFFDYVSDSTGGNPFSKSINAFLDDKPTFRELTIIAIGASGTGKTNTVMDFLNDITNSNCESRMISISATEINDVFARDIFTGKSATVAFDRNSTIHTCHHTFVKIGNKTDIERACSRINRRRLTTSTNLNPVSSRSQLIIRIRFDTSGEQEIMLNIIDMAGYEPVESADDHKALITINSTLMNTRNRGANGKK